MSDEEQVEKLQEWWKENGRAVIAGVIIAVAAVLGWQQWQAYHERQAEAASMAYLQLLDARERGADVETVARRGEQVMEDFGGSPYAAMAGLQLADYHANRGDLAAAEGPLRWVMDNAGDDSYSDLARLRLAQVLQGEERLEEALEVLGAAGDGPFESRYNELRGDILADLGRTDEAVAAYDAALEADDLSSVRRHTIQLKRTDVAGGAQA